VAARQRVGADLIDVLAAGVAVSYHPLDSFDGIYLSDQAAITVADTVDAGHCLALRVRAS